MLLRNRVALITGASRGIGRAVVLGYAKEGARLALAARTTADLEETARQAEALGSTTCVVSVDVTDQGLVDDMVRRTLDRFGCIDILINNAGITGPVGPVQDNDVTHLIQVIQVNLIGVFLCCRAVLPVMLSQNRGKIINLFGGGGRNLSAYGMSKAAVVSLTESLPMELEGRDIQVNAVGPGSIHTYMWEETRDAAKAVGDTGLYDLGKKVTSGGGASMDRAVQSMVFLASDASGKLSGRLIDAVRDDFDRLRSQIPEIMGSDIYTMRRVDPV